MVTKSTKEVPKDVWSKWNVPLTVSKSFFYDFIAVREKFGAVKEKKERYV